MPRVDEMKQTALHSAAVRSKSKTAQNLLNFVTEYLSDILEFLVLPNDNDEKVGLDHAAEGARGENVLLLKEKYDKMASSL